MVQANSTRLFTSFGRVALYGSLGYAVIAGILTRTERRIADRCWVRTQLWPLDAGPVTRAYKA